MNPAKMSPELARELASLVLEAAYGMSFVESSAKCGQLGLLSRTSLQGPAAGSIPSVGTWQSSTMKRYRSRLRRRMSAHPISGGGSSLLRDLYGDLPRLSPTTAKLLPTPTVNGNNNRHNREGSTSGDGLTTAINRIGLLPTPMSNDGARGDCPSERDRRNPALPTAAKLLPTPTSCDATSGPGHAASAQGSQNLRTVLLPTPTASSYGTNKGGGAGRVGPERPSLPSMAKSGALGQSTGCLNPAFVEWMMGLFGWTDPMGDVPLPDAPAGREPSD